MFPKNLLEKIGGYLAMVGKSFDWDLWDQRGGASGAGYIPTTPSFPFGGIKQAKQICGWFFWRDFPYTPWKFNIAPENGWLEDEFPFGIPYFQGLC